MKRMLGENLARIEPGLSGKTLGERRNAAVGKIEFHALDPVHGKENHPWRKWLSLLNQRNQILERSQFDAT